MTERDRKRQKKTERKKRNKKRQKETDRDRNRQRERQIENVFGAVNLIKGKFGLINSNVSSGIPYTAR